MQLRELGVDAWTYYLAPAALPAGAQIIGDPSWPEHVRRTKKVLPEIAPPGTHRDSA